MADDPQRPIKLARFSTELRANLLASALEAAGITVEVVGGPTAGFRAEAPGEVIVLVRADDRQAAEKVLAAFNDETGTATDDEDAEALDE